MFQDESGCDLRPPKARTWSPRGHTPQITVRARGSGRVCLAAMIAMRPGHRTRLIYRTLTHHGRRREKKGFKERDLAAHLDAAHQQLRAPIILVWDNATAHDDALIHRLIAARPWLTVTYLPAYAPVLNPVEGVWAWLKRHLANLAPYDIDQVAAIAKQHLRHLQQPANHTLDGFIAETGLTLEPP